MYIFFVDLLIIDSYCQHSNNVFRNNCSLFYCTESLIKFFIHILIVLSYEKKSTREKVSKKVQKKCKKMHYLRIKVDNKNLFFALRVSTLIIRNI